MIFRFSLYGFLKNQRYFEAFLFLAFIEKGLSFFQIGLLVAARQAVINLLEVPSGSLADVFGRRRTMILSLAASMAGFAALGAAEGIGGLLLGMALLGVGDSFRSGTHKAMIFTWLGLQGRTSERIAVYGYTRSWSQFGSALSVVVGAAIVVAADRYSWAFYAAALPYALGIANILSYPSALDGAGGGTPRTMAGLLRHLKGSLRSALGRPSLRRLVGESMGCDGVFAAVKDYLQPALEAAALSSAALLAVASGLSDTRRTALLVAPVYVLLFLLSGVASRLSHRLTAAAGGEEAAARRLWGAHVVVFTGVLVAGWVDAVAGLIAAFVLLHVLHNIWRPILISRFDTHGDEQQGATLLSIESQAQRLATMVLAPLLGVAVDWARGSASAGGGLWPIGAVGAAVSLAFLLAAAGRGAGPCFRGALPSGSMATRPPGDHAGRHGARHRAREEAS